jgi:predicted dehydrogenase
MVWLTWTFGGVERLSCMKDKIGDLEADIDDIYQLLLKFKTGAIGHLMVDVLARPDIRHMRIVGTEGVMEWVSKQNALKVSNMSDYSWETIELNQGTMENQYTNPEEPYIEEMDRFIRAIHGQGDFGYTFEEDFKILQILYKAEESSVRLKHVNIES